MESSLLHRPDLLLDDSHKASEESWPYLMEAMLNIDWNDQLFAFEMCASYYSVTVWRRAARISSLRSVFIFCK